LYAGVQDSYSGANSENDSMGEWISISMPGETKDLEVKQVGLFYRTGFVLYTNGDLYMWGSNDAGQLGRGNTSDSFEIQKISVGDISKVVTTPSGINNELSSVFALTDSNKLYGWGYNLYGQLGDGTNTDKLSPTLINVGGEDVIDVKTISSTGHTLALTSTNKVYSTGRNVDGQLGLSDNTDRNVFTVIPSLVGKVVDQIEVSGGYWTGSVYLETGVSYFKTTENNGSVYACGYNLDGELGDNTVVSKNIPTIMNHNFVAEPAKKLYINSNGAANGFFISTNDIVFGWGWNNVGQVGDGTVIDVLSPTQIRVDVKDIFNFSNGVLDSNYKTTFFQDIDDKLYSVGANNSGNCAVGGVTHPQLTQELVDFPFASKIIDYYSVGDATDLNSLYFLLDDGRFYGWGSNDNTKLYPSNDSAIIPRITLLNNR